MKPKLFEQFYDNGNIELKEWILNGKHHREDGPAYILYSPGGSIVEKIWYSHGNPHRLGEAARIIYRRTGEIQHELWMLNGLYHREDGPAWIEYDRQGNVLSKEWYIDGSRIEVESIKDLDLIKKLQAYELFTPDEIVKMRLDK